MEEVEVYHEGYHLVGLKGNAVGRLNALVPNVQRRDFTKNRLCDYFNESKILKFPL